MEKVHVKGAAVKVIPEFVQKKFGPFSYEKWLGSLPEEIKKAIELSLIKNSFWYPIEEYFIQPTINICNLFYNGSFSKAVELGEFSAEYSINNIYKTLFKTASLKFLFSKAPIVLGTFYKPVEIKAVKIDKNKTILHIIKFNQIHEVVEYRIAGWVKRGIEINRGKDVKVSITKSLAKGDQFTEIVSEWE